MIVTPLMDLLHGIKCGDKIEISLATFGKQTLTAQTDVLEKNNLRFIIFMFDNCLTQTRRTENEIESFFNHLRKYELSTPIDDLVLWVNIPTFGQIFGHKDKNVDVTSEYLYEDFKSDSDKQFKPMTDIQNRIALYNGEPHNYWLHNPKINRYSYIKRYAIVTEHGERGCSISSAVRGIMHIIALQLE